jgi:hypothetical protein
VHFLRHDVTAEDAARFYDDIRPLTSLPDILAIDVTGLSGCSSSPCVSAFLSFLECEARSHGKAFRVLAGRADHDAGFQRSA